MRIHTLLLVVLLLNSAGASDTRPNVTLVMSDDVSPDLYGCYGNTRVQTPNLGRMAREGVKFETCRAMAMCAP